MKFTSTENSSSASRVVIRTSNVFGIFTHHLEGFYLWQMQLLYPKEFYISKYYFFLDTSWQCLEFWRSSRSPWALRWPTIFLSCRWAPKVYTNTQGQTGVRVPCEVKISFLTSSLQWLVPPWLVLNWNVSLIVKRSAVVQTVARASPPPPQALN